MMAASAAPQAWLEQSRIPLEKSAFLQRQEASGVPGHPRAAACPSMLLMQSCCEGGKHKLEGKFTRSFLNICEKKMRGLTPQLERAAWPIAEAAKAATRAIEYFMVTEEGWLRVRVRVSMRKSFERLAEVIDCFACLESEE